MSDGGIFDLLINPKHEGTARQKTLIEYLNNPMVCPEVIAFVKFYKKVEALTEETIPMGQVIELAGKLNEFNSTDGIFSLNLPSEKQEKFTKVIDDFQKPNQSQSKAQLLESLKAPLKELPDARIFFQNFPCFKNSIKSF